MTENAPPNASGGAANFNDSTRGMPYYEQQQRALRQLLAKKRETDGRLEQLDSEIYRLEENYLQETSPAGNIIKGFDNYLKASTSSTTSLSTAAGSLSQGTSTRRKVGIGDADRVFSRSSVSYLRGNDGTASPGPNSDGTTPRDAPTPSSGLLSATAVGTPKSDSAPGKAAAGTNKKKKGAEKKDEADEDGEGKPMKRGKITYARE